MIRSDAVAEIARRLGNRTDLNNTILKQMGYVQEFVLERLPVLPWFLVTENLTTSTTVGEPRVLHPVGFLREVEGGAVWRERTPTAEDPRPWVELVKRMPDELRTALGDQLDATGAPTHYAILGAYWHMAPVPDAIYAIKTRCYRKDTLPVDLSGGSAENLWLRHSAELLVAETTYRLSRHLQYSREIIADFRNDRDEARRFYFISQESRDHTNFHYQMGIARGS